jgi:galactose mutarotase-like enzyme
MSAHRPRICAGDTSATVDLLGGRVATFQVGEQAIFFAPSVPPPEDRPWVQPPGSWVHAGNPILFPQAGTLAGDRLAEAGTTLPAHGLVYGRPWSLDVHWASRLACSIASDEQTLRAFPFAWRLVQEVVVGPRTLRCSLRISNPGTSPFPVAPGWHPYFAVPLDEKSSLSIDPLPSFRPPASPDAEIDDIYVLPREAPLTLRWPSRELRVATSEHCHTMVAWTMPGEPFICVEPWVGPPDALNDLQARLVVEPGATLALWMEMSLIS